MVLLVIPLITAHFASKLIVDTDAFRHEEQEELKNNLRAVRALLEQLAAREGITAAGQRCPLRRNRQIDEVGVDRPGDAGRSAGRPCAPRPPR